MRTRKPRYNLGDVINERDRWDLHTLEEIAHRNIQRNMDDLVVLAVSSSWSDSINAASADASARYGEVVDGIGITTVWCLWWRVLTNRASPVCLVVERRQKDYRKQPSCSTKIRLTEPHPFWSFLQAECLGPRARSAVPCQPRQDAATDRSNRSNACAPASGQRSSRAGPGKPPAAGPFAKIPPRPISQKRERARRSLWPLLNPIESREPGVPWLPRCPFFIFFLLYFFIYFY
jgi:hypothetical protein